jgi:hypothetical protein
MWVHCVILDIFQPFITSPKQSSFVDWNSEVTYAEAIFTASMKQLKHMILTFKALNPSAGYDIWWHVALMFTANGVIKNHNDPDRRFYFMRCIKCYQDLYKCFEISKGISQGLLSMGIENKVISVAEATGLNQELHEKRQDQQLSQEMPAEPPSKYAFILDFNLATHDRSAASADTLIEKFEVLTLFSEFTVEGSDQLK